jgi:acetyl esterase/lipase
MATPWLDGDLGWASTRARRRFRGVIVVTVVLAATAGVLLVVLPGSPSTKSRATLGSSTTRPTSPSTTTTTTPPPPYAVADSTITLDDPSRPTPARGSVPGHQGRVLVTDIRRPVGLSGPLPLVVFAHGWNSNPLVYETLLDAWAAAGFVVAAPTFPDSTNSLPGTPVSNYPAQAEDMSFVITSMLGGVAGPIDPTRIAVAGHSDGGTDIALMALNPAYTDPRVRAYLSLSGEIPTGVAGPWGVPIPGALLVAVGTADEYGLFPRASQMFQTADMPKAFVTLAGGDHLSTFTGDTPGAAAMRTETVRFLNIVFDSRAPTPAQLQSGLLPSGDPSLMVQTSD